MSSAYRLAYITPTPRPLVDGSGAPLRNPDLSQVGASVSGVLLHWMDAPQATAWVGYARAQHTAAVTNRDPVALQNAAKALMAAYNALNIPWEIDPPARFEYQRMLAGPPGSAGILPEFGAGPGNPYNATVWLGPDPLRCIVVPGAASGSTFGGCNSDNAGGGLVGAPFTGLLPALARQRYDIWTRDAGGTALQYLPRLQFVLRVRDGESSLGAQYQTTGDPHVPLPYDPALLSAALVFNDALWRTEPKQRYVRTDGSDAGGDPDGWDVCAFDASAFGVPEQIRLSWADYAPYVSRWIAMLEHRTPQQVVQDARAYAMFRNSKTLSAAGDTSFATLGGAVEANLATLQTPSTSVGNDLRIAGAAAAATGVALAPVTAGVSAIVGGVVSVLASIGAQLVPPDLTRLSIDDLERPKPWIERSWLAGSPADASNYGAPDLSIPDPPGWTRPPVYHSLLGSTLLGHAATVIAANQPAPLTTQTPLGSLGALAATVPVEVWLGAGLAIGAASLYAGYRLTQGAPARPPRTSTRRSRSRR